MLIRNIQSQQYIEILKYTRNLHDFELQTHIFLHIEPKTKIENCITSHNPL